MKLQRLGGYAAIASICVYTVLIAFASLRLRHFGDLSDPLKAMAARSAAPADFYVINLLLIVGYILWLILTFALHERMQANAPHLTRMALIAATVGTAIAITESMISTRMIEMIVPTKDVSAYRALEAMTAGLSSLEGHAYGWVCLLIGCAVLSTRAFSKIPGWLFLLAGILWIPRSYVPMGPQFLSLISWLFCFVSIVWFGIVMLRKKQSRPASREMAASS
jgi:hypothetical protein